MTQDQDAKSTQEKILRSARKLFVKKGYAATKTRDIAEDAGINLALLNYYFRTKEKLFELVMIEKMGKFLGIVAGIVNDPKTTLEEKVGMLANNYIDMLKADPSLPVFVLGEMHSNPKKLFKLIEGRTNLLHSVFMQQVQKITGKKGINPIHFMVNLLGMAIFPFVSRPLLMQMGDMDAKMFDQLMDERKKLIPTWIECMFLSAKP